MAEKILVLGLGQSMRGDDAAGLEAVKRWQSDYPETASDPSVRVEQAELPGLGLLDFLSDATHALLVDAVRSGAAPGSLHLVSADRLESFAAGFASAHGWGVAETLALATELQSPLPKHLTLLGIEALSLDMGAPLSTSVAESMPAAVEKIQAQIMKWLAA